MPFFVHPNFLQSPFQSFILPSYVEASALAISGPILHPPISELKTHYHAGVEIFIDDEVRETSV
jgi:hypothetical protein